VTKVIVQRHDSWMQCTVFRQTSDFSLLNPCIFVDDRHEMQRMFSVVSYVRCELCACIFKFSTHVRSLIAEGDEFLTGR